MLLPHVLNSTWSAEYDEFASIVIELVIGILLSPANSYMPFVQHYKLHRCCEVKLQLQITVFENL